MPPDVLKKNTPTTVLIRQICICPCAIMPVIKAAQPAAAEDIDDKQLGKMAEKAVRWKLRGDRALVQTYVIHLFYVLGALIFVAQYPSSPPGWKSLQVPHAIDATSSP